LIGFNQFPIAFPDGLIVDEVVLGFSIAVGGVDYLYD